MFSIFIGGVSRRITGTRFLGYLHKEMFGSRITSASRILIGSGYSERSARKIQTPGNHPNERIQHSEHGEIWKSGIDESVFIRFCVVESVLGKLAECWALGNENRCTI